MEGKAIQRLPHVGTIPSAKPNLDTIADKVLADRSLI